MSKSVFKYEGVQWSLPMLFQYEAVYATIYRTLENYDIRLPEAFLYGSPASAWSGGRPPTVFERFTRQKLLKIMNYVYSQNAVPTFTFSCTDITKESLEDKYANFLLDTGLEVNARFIVYSDLLRDYIKSKKADATVVASVIKPAFRFQGPNKIEEPTVENETAYYNKLLKEYDIVVVRPEYSKGAMQENPNLLDDISRVEVLINQTCVNNCPKMPAHYRFLEALRLGPDAAPQPNKNRGFECVRANMPRRITYQNYLCHTQEQVEKLVQMGVKHLKLQGRSDNFAMNSMLMLIFGQIFNQDGQNYLISSDLAQNGMLAQEMDVFSRIVADQQMMQSMPQRQEPQGFRQQMGQQPMMENQPMQPQMMENQQMGQQPMMENQQMQPQMTENFQPTEQEQMPHGCCDENSFQCPYHTGNQTQQIDPEQLRYLVHLQEHQNQHHQNQQQNNDNVIDVQTVTEQK